MDFLQCRKTKIVGSIAILVIIACALFVIIFLKNSSNNSNNSNASNSSINSRHSINSDNLTLDNEVLAGEDFEVKYSVRVGHKEYKRELHILGDGKYSFTTTNTLTDETSITEGEVDIKLVKDFISYALKKGI